MWFTSHVSDAGLAWFDPIYLQVLITPDRAGRISIYILQYALPLFFSITFSTMTVVLLKKMENPISDLQSGDVVQSFEKKKLEKTVSQESVADQKRRKRSQKTSILGTAWFLGTLPFLVDWFDIG